GAKVEVSVAPNKVAKAKLVVSGRAELAVTCDGPCKLTLEGIEGTASPDFGPSHVAGPARNQVTSETGRIAVPLAPGKYRGTASRGPEYAIAQLVQELKAGETARREAKLARVVDTKGYLSTDFHQHTMLGADAPVATRDRVIANVAEGVEIAVASEHNV